MSSIGRFTLAGVLCAVTCSAPHAAPTTLAIAGATQGTGNTPVIMPFAITRSCRR